MICCNCKGEIVDDEFFYKLILCKKTNEEGHAIGNFDYCRPCMKSIFNGEKNDTD